jgi:hypothetical protein
MSKSGEAHYLTCLSDHCENAPCVDRREFQGRISRLLARNVKYKAALVKISKLGMKTHSWADFAAAVKGAQEALKND